MAEPSPAIAELKRAECSNRPKLRDSVDDSESKKPEERVKKRRACTVASARPVRHYILKNKFKSEESRRLKDVRKPNTKKLSEVEVFSLKDGKPNPEILKQHFLEEGRLEYDCARKLILQAKELFEKEPNTLHLKPDLNVCGDIHGQFYDLVVLLEEGGSPGSNQYLFLGDYVDRGCYSTEVMFYLLSWKINYPDTFYMLRGNHECRLLTENFNFLQECLCKYNEELWDEFMLLFDALPLAALVTTEYGTFYCVHGGLSPDILHIEEVDQIDRFQEPPGDGPFCDLLWSDPIEEETADDLEEDEMQDWYNVEYVENPHRGCGYIFGYKAAVDFLENNHLTALVRAHEVQREGYFNHYFRMDLEGIPPVITVFSAPNYCDLYYNRAAILRFDASKYFFRQIDWSDHPFCFPDFTDAIGYSLPFVLENLTDLFLSAMDVIEGEQQNIGSKEEPSLKDKIQRVGKMMMLMRKLSSSKKSQLVNEADLEKQYPGLSKFERALKVDRSRDHLRPSVQSRARSRTF